MFLLWAPLSLVDSLLVVSVCSARLLSIWGRIPSLEETIERIDDVTTAKVKAFAAKTASQSGAAMALYGPAEAAPSLEELRARLAA